MHIAVMHADILASYFKGKPAAARKPVTGGTLVLIFVSFGDSGCIDLVGCRLRARTGAAQTTKGDGRELRCVAGGYANAEAGIPAGTSVGTEDLDCVVDAGYRNHGFVGVA
jgi:hypothetical protein